MSAPAEPVTVQLDRWERILSALGGGPVDAAIIETLRAARLALLDETERDDDGDTVVVRLDPRDAAFAVRGLRRAAWATGRDYESAAFHRIADAIAVHLDPGAADRVE